MNVWNASSAGKSAALPGMPAQNSVGQSVVLWRGTQPIEASWLPTSFLMRFSSSASSLHAITLKWARTDFSPCECASFRYSSTHSLFIAFWRLYRESDCMFLAVFSKRRSSSSLLPMNTYWL